MSIMSLGRGRAELKSFQVVRDNECYFYQDARPAPPARETAEIVDVTKGGDIDVSAFKPR